MSLFQKAEVSQSKLRLFLDGPAGSGKSFTALSIFKGMELKRIAAIDTENGSLVKTGVKDASLIENLFVINMASPNPPVYLGAIAEAAKEGFDGIILDSSTHLWEEILQEVENIAKAKFGGNTFRAWGESDSYQRFVRAIIQFPGHVITTARTKSEWVIEQNASGKMAPRKVGTKTNQREGIEFEHDLHLRMSQDHVAHVLKDRILSFQDMAIDKPGVEFGKEILNGLGGIKVSAEDIKILELFAEFKLSREAQAAARIKYPTKEELLKVMLEKKAREDAKNATA